MLDRSAAILLILLLLAGNAALVQGVAWAGMLMDRAQRMDWNAAVTSTLSGAAPCPMCRIAATLRDKPGPGLPTPERQQLGKLPSAPPGPMPCLQPGGGGSVERVDPPAVAGAPDEFCAPPQPPPPQRI